MLNGALGVSPGTSLTGFGLPAVVNGATHNNDAVAAQAQGDLTAAYLVAAGQPVTSDMTGLDLGNRTVTAGAYRYSSSAQLTGPLTLDAQGDANAQFVFMIGSTLTTASASSVLLINGASACNVFWQVGSSATLGTTTAFQGNVLALSDISLNNGATVIGRMLARNGQITLINNVLNGSACGTSTTAPGTPGDGSTPGTVRNGTARFVRQPRRGGNASGPACMRRLPRQGPRSRDQEGRLQHGRQACRQPYQVPVSGLCAGRIRQSQGQGARHVQGRHRGQDADAPLPGLRGSSGESAPRPIALHRVSHPPCDALRPPGSRRGVSALLVALFAAAAAGTLVAPAQAGAARVAARQPLVVLLDDHVARTHPSPHAHRIESVAARRPLTRVRTVLPVIGHARAPGGQSWAHVRLPGRPSGHKGWIPTHKTRPAVTAWHISVKLSARRVTVHRFGRVKRRFRAVVGKPATPTPRGRFFVEEALTLSSQAPGGPFALATSARSNVLQEFEGGPGQIALHGMDNLSGALGTAVSHGCIRLSTRAITWLAKRIRGGVPLTVRR